MKLDNRTLAFITGALALAALLNWAPVWLPLTAAVIWLAIAMQSGRESKAAELKAEEERLVEFVPELAGMAGDENFCKRASYCLSAIDEFKAKYGPDLARVFVERYETGIAAIREKGSSEPDWYGLYVMRLVERDFLAYAEGVKTAEKQPCVGESVVAESSAHK